MSLIRDYYYRFQILVHEVAKFGIVGALGFVVQLAVQNPLHFKLGVGPLKAEIVGYIAATVVTFLGNRHWAFKHRKGKGLVHEATVFMVMNTIGLGLQLGTVALATYGLGLRDGISYNIATMVGIGLGTIFRLFAYRKFVFMAQPSSVEAESLQAEVTR